MKYSRPLVLGYGCADIRVRAAVGVDTATADDEDVGEVLHRATSMMCECGDCVGAGGGEAEAVEATTRSEELLLLLPTVMVEEDSWAELLEEAVVFVSFDDIELMPLLELDV